MSDFGMRLEHAEERLDKAQGALDAIGRVLESVEKAQAASERARSAVRSTNVLLLCMAIAAGTLVVALRKRH